jgi:hypothetical protein
VYSEELSSQSDDSDVLDSDSGLEDEMDYGDKVQDKEQIKAMR